MATELKPRDSSACIDAERGLCSTHVVSRADTISGQSKFSDGDTGFDDALSLVTSHNDFYM